VDRIIAGSTTGIATGIFSGFFTTILSNLGIIGYNSIPVSVGLFAGRLPESPVSLSWLIVGWAGHLVKSAIFGMLLSYVLTGRNYRYFKGALLGAIAWYFSFAVMAPLLDYVLVPPLTSSDLNHSLVRHLLFGLFNAWLLARYAK